MTVSKATNKKVVKSVKQFTDRNKFTDENWRLRIMFDK